MTSRNLWNLALFVGVISCSGTKDVGDSGAEDGDADTDTDSDTDSDSTPTGDTSPPEPEFFTVAGLSVSASFGWDNNTQSIVTPTNTNGDIPPSIFIVFGDQDWLDSLYAGTQPAPEDQCYILLPLTTPSPVPQWVIDDPQIFFGFDYLPSDPPETDCNAAGGHPFDPNVSGGDAGFIDYWAGTLPEWGVGVGALRPDSEVPNMASLVTAVVGQLGVPETSIFGGVIQNVALPSDVASGFAGTLRYAAFANAMDASYAEQATFLEATEIVVPSGGVASGSYYIVTSTLWTYGR